MFAECISAIIDCFTFTKNRLTNTEKLPVISKNRFNNTEKIPLISESCQVHTDTDAEQKTLDNIEENVDVHTDTDTKQENVDIDDGDGVDLQLNDEEKWLVNVEKNIQLYKYMNIKKDESTEVYVNDCFEYSYEYSDDNNSETDYNYTQSHK